MSGGYFSSLLLPERSSLSSFEERSDWRKRQSTDNSGGDMRLLTHNSLR